MKTISVIRTNITPHSDEYNRMALCVIANHCINIKPCPACKYPVLKGFICENCDIERPHDADTKTFEIEIGEK